MAISDYFIWGKNGEMLTPEQVARERDRVAAIQGRAGDTSPVAHWSQGAARVVDALTGVVRDKRADKAEAAGMAQGRAAFDPVLRALMGGGSGGVTASSMGASLAASTPAPDGAALGFGADVPAMPQEGGDWLKYANKSATRNQPINGQLQEALSFLPEMGVQMEVFSGGQDPEGPNRVGSHRHDHGNAGDVFFSKEGRRLDWANPADQPIFAEIVQKAKARGVTGFGAGDGYMQPGSMHLGFGAPSVWGAGGKGENAAGWLQQAYNGAPQDAGGGSPITMSTQGQPAAQGGGGILAALLQAQSDPWAAKQYGPVINALLGSELTNRQNAQDPMRQLEMQRAQLEIDAMRNPAQKPIEVGGVLLDPNTYQPIFDSRQGAGADQFTLGAGQVRYNPDGTVIAQGPAAAPQTPDTKTIKLSDGSDVLVQWNPQTQVWDAAPVPAGGTGGAPPTKLTEGQAKLTLFQTLQTETQPVLLDLEKEFNPANLTDPTAARLPIAGNYFTSPEYQIYKSAASSWSEGALRISTGAAATPDEMTRTLSTYFAVPGDTPQTVAFKAQMREMYSRAVNNSLGKTNAAGSLPLPSEFAAKFEGQGGAVVETSAQGDGFQAFAADPTAQAAAAKYGVTIEEMWAIKQGLD